MDSIVAAIVETLESRGDYALLTSPMKIADMTFSFDAMLLGVEKNGDLVIVQSLTEDGGVMVRRRILALVTLLDRQNAMKPVTLVLVVRGTVPTRLDELEQVCRVILVTPSTSLDSALRPLLRLKLPLADKQRLSAETVLMGDLGSLANDPFVLQLISASQSGPEAVKDVLTKEFELAVNPLIPPGKS